MDKADLEYFGEENFHRGWEAWQRGGMRGGLPSCGGGGRRMVTRGTIGGMVTTLTPTG